VERREGWKRQGIRDDQNENERKWARTADTMGEFGQKKIGGKSICGERSKKDGKALKR
jgi:hypothetical protein